MSQQANKGTPTAREVARGVYQIEIPTPFSVGAVNIYLIEGDQLTLVDVGPMTSKAWDAVVSGMEQLGFALTDIKQIVLTHHHVDHCGLLEKMRRLTNATTYAHPLAVPYIEMDPVFLDFHDQFFMKLYRESGLPEEMLGIIKKFNKLMMTFSEQSKIDGLLKHQEAVPGLPQWQVLYTPGHSQSHLSLYRAQDRIMVAGDHIIKHVSSNAFIEPPRNHTLERPLTLVQYRTALQMCADMEIDQIFSGHGEVVTNHRELIAQRLQKNWERSDHLKNFLRDGAKTAFELNALLFPSLYQKELPLTLSETLGHLDLLRILHQVTVKDHNGVYYYSL